MGFKEDYEPLREKYNLPSKEELEKEFELDSPEDTQPLRAVRKKMSEKLEQYVKFIDELMQPDSSFANMYEVRDFSDEDKEKAFKLFKRMMVLYRETVKLNLNLGEEKDAKFISGFYKAWKEMKPQLIDVITKIQDTWSSDDDKDIKQEYLG